MFDVRKLKPNDVIALKSGAIYYVTNEPIRKADTRDWIPEDLKPQIASLYKIPCGTAAGSCGHRLLLNQYGFSSLWTIDTVNGKKSNTTTRFNKPKSSKLLKVLESSRG